MNLSKVDPQKLTYWVMLRTVIAKNKCKKPQRRVKVWGKKCMQW